MSLKEQPIWTRSFFFVFMATLLIFTAFYLLLPTLPIYLINHLKVGSAYTGVVLAAYTVAALVIRPATGYFIDLHGRKWIYLISVLIFSLLFAGYIFAVTLAGMIMLRLMHGLLWGITTTSGNTIAVDLVPSSRRGEGLSYFGLSSTIPMAIGPLIGLKLIADGNYHRMFIVAIILSLSGFALALGVRYPVIERPKVPFSIKNLFEKSTLPLALVLLINMISYGGLVSFISIYVKETNIGDAGLFFMIYAVGIAFSRLFSGRVFDRSGPFRLSVAAFGMLITGFMALALIQTTYGFMGAALLLGMGSGMIFPTLQAMVNNLIEPHRRGAANSTLFTALDLGIGTGMMLTGYLAGTIGLIEVFLIFSALNMLALALFLSFALKHYHQKKIQR